MTGNRAGKSLVELSVVIGLLSVVLILATRTITFLMQAEGAGRAAVVSETNFSRLADRFRKNTHAATKAERLDGDNNAPQKLQLTQPDGRVVEFRPGMGRVQVVVLRDQKTQEREVYHLNGGMTRFEITEGEQPLVSLLYETGDDASRRHKTVRIDALRGKDHRFSKQSN